MKSYTQQLPTIEQKEVEQLLSLFEFTAEDQQALVACKPYIIGSIDSLVEKFYDQLLQHPQIKDIIDKDGRLPRLKIEMHEYIQDLFCGKYDVYYVITRMQIGKVHDQMNISPQLYLASTTQLLMILTNFINESINDVMDASYLKRCQNAITKILMFDTQIVLDTYYDTLIRREKYAKNELNQSVESLEEKNKLLDDMSRRDMLTKLYNHRAFMEHLQREYSNARRNLYPISILFIDLNEFKKANDKEGHQAGDDILKLVSIAMLKAIRESDIACRIGGDEFCIIFPNTSAEEVAFIGKRIMDIFDKSPRIGVSMSLGVAQTGPTEFVTKEKFIKIADNLMYKAKEKSRSLPNSQMEMI